MKENQISLSSDVKEKLDVFHFILSRESWQTVCSFKMCCFSVRRHKHNAKFRRLNNFSHLFQTIADKKKGSLHLEKFACFTAIDSDGASDNLLFGVIIFSILMLILTLLSALCFRSSSSGRRRCAWCAVPSSPSPRPSCRTSSTQSDSSTLQVRMLSKHTVRLVNSPGKKGLKRSLFLSLDACKKNLTSPT